MTKHIHIHLPPGARVTSVRSGDSAFDEGQHKRDDGGKFSSTGGGGGANPNSGMAGPGTVRSVTGNVATVAYQVKGPDGKMYNRMGEFHVTKLFPADSKPASKLPQLKVRGFTATAEASPDGTFRAKLLNDDGSVHRLTATSFKTAQEAAEHAEQIALGNKK